MGLSTNRWKRILALFAWKPRWAVYGRYAYIWEPMVYKPQPIVFDLERDTYNGLTMHARYLYTGLVASPQAVFSGTI